MKPKSMDVDESQVYQELLCFSSNSQHDWPSTEKVSVVCNLNVCFAIKVPNITVFHYKRRQSSLFDV